MRPCCDSNIPSGCLFGVSSFCFVGVLYMMGLMVHSAVKEHTNASSRRSLMFIYMCTLFIWTLFPVAWVLRVVHPSSTYKSEILNLFANFMAKVGVDDGAAGIGCWVEHQSSPCRQAGWMSCLVHSCGGHGGGSKGQPCSRGSFGVRRQSCIGVCCTGTGARGLMRATNTHKRWVATRLPAWGVCAGYGLRSARARN